MKNKEPTNNARVQHAIPRAGATDKTSRPGVATVVTVWFTTEEEAATFAAEVGAAHLGMIEPNPPLANELSRAAARMTAIQLGAPPGL